MSVKDYLRNLFKPVAPVETWEQTKIREAAEYLAHGRVNVFNFGYMPRIMGEVMGGRLSVTVLTNDELRWWADESMRSIRVNEGMGDAARLDRAYLDVAVAELQARGIRYTAPAVVPPFVAPPPPNDPTRGR